MKHAKRISALLLTVLMVLGIGVTAGATSTGAATLIGGDQEGQWNASSEALTGITFKSVMLRRIGTPLPGTKIGYKLSTANEIPTGDDYANYVTGEAGGVYFGTQTTGQTGVASITPNDGKDKATVIFAPVAGSSASPTAVATLTFDTEKLTKGKVNRYVLTQGALDSVQLEHGFVTENGDGEEIQRYLDIYVDSEGKVFAAILRAMDATLTDENKKYDGFTNRYSTTDGGKEATSFNFKLTKKTEGNAIDPNALYPFTVLVDIPYNETYVNTNNIEYNYSVVTNGGTIRSSGSFTVDTSQVAFNAYSATPNLELAAGDTMVIEGQPACTRIGAQETVDETEGYIIGSTVEIWAMIQFRLISLKD